MSNIKDSIKEDNNRGKENSAKEDIRDTKKYKRITMFRKISINIIIIILWFVSATFNVLDIYNGTHIASSPWTYLTLAVSFLLVIVVIVPLFIEIRQDIRKIKNKEELEKNKLSEKNEDKDKK